MIRKISFALILLLAAACAKVQTAQSPLATSSTHQTQPPPHETQSATGHTPEGPPTHNAATPLPNAAFTPSSIVQIQVDGTRRYQIFQGFGASLDFLDEEGLYNRHDTTQPVKTTATLEQRQGIARILYQELGIARTRSVLTQFEPQNYNADPFTFNPDRFDWTLVDPEAAFFRFGQPYGLQTPWLSFGVDSTADEAWLRLPGSNCALNPAMIDEEVEWILAGIMRFRDDGVTIPYAAINNEPDLCPPGYKIEIADMMTIIKRLGARLRAEGLQTKIVVSDGWLPENALLYMQAALSDPEARQYVGALAYHSYDAYSDVNVLATLADTGESPHAAVEVRTKIRDLAVQYNLPVWMTEICYCTQTPPYSDFDLIRFRLGHLYDELTISNIEAYDGMNTVFIDRPGIPDQFIHIYFQPDGALSRYEISTYGYVIGQFSRFITPGSVRLDAASNNPRVRVVAFERPDGRLIIVALNNNPFAVQVNLTISGLGNAPSALSVLSSREGALWQSDADITVSAGVATLVLSPLSVTTYLGR